MIGADVHVGSNCVLVAPVTIGDGATIGGGSTISKDAPAGQLTVARAKQVSLAGWKRPVKREVGTLDRQGTSARDAGVSARRRPSRASASSAIGSGALISVALQLVAA